MSCPDGIAPEDVAAWALDGEPLAGVDLASHVASCADCQAVVASLAATTDVSATLRAAAEPAPEQLVERAVARVRMERSAGLVVRTVLGSIVRVARALPTYLAVPAGARSGDRADSQEDTQEFELEPTREVEQDPRSG